MLSLTTDYVTDHGDPEPHLRAMASAGFTHVHWCHHWRSDFMYATAEIEEIARWLDTYGLQLIDLHGSEGIEKFWYSPKEYARQAGIELVKNRIAMTARLGGDAVVMHIYPPTRHPDLSPFNDHILDQVRRSLDDLEPFARGHGVRIALENLIDFQAVAAGVIRAQEADDNAVLLGHLFEQYAPDYLGFCFDSGHAILGRDRTGAYVPFMARLAVLHLHDNNGSEDQHLPVYSGQVNWEKVARLIAASAYAKPLSYELSIHNTGMSDETRFLAQAFASSQRFAAMVEQFRAPGSGNAG
ncbi:MAG: sugar phosphate isomerase/epimerase [Caldilineaceae bacterium]|nr:sugar phosphate isomerase/epimerase [Caldilineaceae bacterium]